MIGSDSMTTVVTPLSPVRNTAQNHPAASSARRSIGAILVDSGRLTQEAAEWVMRQQKATGQRFGDVAIQLGLLTEDDVRQALSHQFDYSYLAPSDKSLSPELVAAYKPFSATVEQLRALRSQLMLRWFDVDANRKALAVVAPASGAGASFIAANLAVVFSQLGERTLLIDANLRAPRQHSLFRISAGPGLSDLLSGHTGFDPIVRLQSFMGLSVLPAGAVPPNPQELLGRTVFSDLLGKLTQEHDVVLIDTPAAAEFADAQTIASRAGAAIMVVQRNKSSVSQMTLVAQQIQQTGALLVGSVLNDGA